MAARSNNGMEIRRPECFGHNSGETLTDLEQLLREQKIEDWPIDRVIQRERNPRRHPPRKQAALSRSIVSLGVFVPLVVDPAGNLLAGHARLAVAMERGFRKVRVIVVYHLTDTQKRLYALADNRIPELSTWDMPTLKLESVNCLCHNLIWT